MKRATIAAAIIAVVSGYFTVPDFAMQIIAAILSFAVIFGVLVICLRLLPVARWSLAGQRVFVWLIAVVIGVASIPLATWVLIR